MSEEKSSNMFSNAKLSTIFMVVLGLHVVVIVLISAYHLLKGGTSTEMTQRMSPPEPRSYASILTEEADVTSPEVITAYDTPLAASTDADMDQNGIPLPMPAANDPIWTGQPPVTNDIDPKMVETANRAEAAPQPVLAETTGFRPAPMAEKKIEPVKEITRPAAVIQGVEYIVRKGDTLSGIASRYRVKVTEIQKANQLDSSMIRIGQKLMLPGVNDLASIADAAPEAVTSMAKPAPRAATVSTGTYTVSKGDTLWKISRKFSTTPQAIASLNGISDPSKLRAGDTIKVPNTSSSAAAGSVETTTDMAMVPGA